MKIKTNPNDLAACTAAALGRPNKFAQGAGPHLLCLAELRAISCPSELKDVKN